MGKSAKITYPNPYPIHTRIQLYDNKCQYKNPILCLFLFLLMFFLILVSVIMLIPAPIFISIPPIIPNTIVIATTT
jgi:hypothetical protein